MFTKKNILMITIKYLIQSKSKTAPIYIYISAGRGKLYKRKTKEIISPSHWNNKKGSVKTLTALPTETITALNETTERLNRLKAFLFREYNGSKDEVCSEWLTEKIEEFYTGKKAQGFEYLSRYLEYFEREYLPSQKAMHKVRKQRFINLIGRLKVFFGKDYPSIKIKDINALTLGKFSLFLEKQGLSKNTAISRIMNLRFMLKKSRSKGVELASDLYDYHEKQDKTPTPYLTEEELKKIKSLDLEDERLRIGREWLIIGCYTGQRISDFIRMDKSMINTIKGREYIILTQEKTSTNVVIPLHQEVKEILSRYNGNFPPRRGGSLNNDTAILNKQIRTLCKLAGIDRKERGRIYDPKQGRYIYGEYPLYQIASSHICRRSFASNHYGKVPTPIIMSITGHKQESTFLNYIGVDDSTLSEQIFNYWDK